MGRPHYVDDIWLTLPVPPITNTRLKPNRKGGFYRDKKNSDYQDLVKAICMKERVQPIDGEVEMNVWWHRKARRGDITDRWKDLCDALQGHAYENDSQICVFHVKRTDEPGLEESYISVNIRRHCEG